jgi:hypothetical protein
LVELFLFRPFLVLERLALAERDEKAESVLTSSSESISNASCCAVMVAASPQDCNSWSNILRALTGNGIDVNSWGAMTDDFSDYCPKK